MGARVTNDLGMNVTMGVPPTFYGVGAALLALVVGHHVWSDRHVSGSGPAGRAVEVPLLTPSRNQCTRASSLRP